MDATSSDWVGFAWDDEDVRVRDWLANRSGAHYRLQCDCGAVISQCRCPSPTKTVGVIPAACKRCRSGQRYESLSRQAASEVLAGRLPSDDLLHQISRAAREEGQGA